MRCKDWKKVTIGDLFYVRNGASIPSKSFHDNSDLVNNYEAFKMGHIAVGGGLRTDPKRSYVTRSEKLNKYLLEKDDIVMGMTDMKDRVVILGVPAIIKESNRYLQNQRVASLRKKDEVSFDIQFVYYQMLTPDYLKPLQSRANRGVQVNLTTNHIKDSTIYLPPIETQQKIVRILSALDQKIELNSQKNGTYFNICRSLLNNYLSAEDLEEHDLSEFLDVFTGKRNANETSPDGKYIFFSCAPEPLRANTYIFDGPAIIIAGNGAYTGRTRFYEGKMELYQRTYACTPKNNGIQPLIYGFYVYMKNKFEQEKMGGTHGSAIPYIVIGDITKYKILYNKERFEKFSTQVKPFIKAIQENENESIILANLRNSLLPKLMSGETNIEKALTNG